LALWHTDPTDLLVDARIAILFNIRVMSFAEVPLQEVLLIIGISRSKINSLQFSTFPRRHMSLYATGVKPTKIYQCDDCRVGYALEAKKKLA